MPRAPRRRPARVASALISSRSALAAVGVEGVEPHVAAAHQLVGGRRRAGSRRPSRRRHRAARSCARRRASRRARAACSGAAPPKAISVCSVDHDAALDRVHARGVGHVLVDDLGDAVGRHLGRQLERPRRRRAPARPRPRSDRASMLAAGEVAADRCVPSTTSASVTVGSRAAAAVAGRAGLGAGAVGPDRDALQRVDAGDRAAAGADLDHLDDRDAHRQAAALQEARGAVDLERARLDAACRRRSGRSWRWCRPCRS